MCDITSEKIIRELKDDYEQFFNMSNNEIYSVSDRYFMFETAKYIAQIIERYDMSFRRRRY